MECQNIKRSQGCNSCNTQMAYRDVPQGCWLWLADSIPADCHGVMAGGRGSLAAATDAAARGEKRGFGIPIRLAIVSFAHFIKSCAICLQGSSDMCWMHCGHGLVRSQWPAQPTAPFHLRRSFAWRREG